MNATNPPIDKQMMRFLPSRIPSPYQYAQRVSLLLPNMVSNAVAATATMSAFEYQRRWGKCSASHRLRPEAAVG
jgi:hypothetical protein